VVQEEAVVLAMVQVAQVILLALLPHKEMMEVMVLIQPQLGEQEAAVVLVQ
tara:strand:- start:274 stop:426 length:153 start_codon:yes stop_codon:yes gene_type:complete